ncbi:MAG: phosphate signaling complex protein PhoU [Clostridiales bacterium]|nr:phosphate signaling complex protein PhoU [Clostridiales bacterium]
MRNRFNEQLLQLNNELITMGALCEEAIGNAAKYLTDSKEMFKNNVYEADKQIDQKERDIETLCMRLLLQQQPVAKDLRTVSSALEIISNMERIGDQASDITEILEKTNKAYINSKSHIADMSEAAIKMVKDSIESFVKNDMVLAYSVIKYDNVVDDLFDKVKDELIEFIGVKSNNVTAMIDLLMIAKYFERIGDHAENIAEWVIYSITGKHVYED